MCQWQLRAVIDLSEYETICLPDLHKDAIRATVSCICYEATKRWQHIINTLILKKKALISNDLKQKLDTVIIDNKV